MRSFFGLAEVRFLSFSAAFRRVGAVISLHLVRESTWILTASDGHGREDEERRGMIVGFVMRGYSSDRQLMVRG